MQSLLARDAAILVEQPEVHLHPRLQSAVGDLFVDTVVSGRAQLLVETHSEHLVLRLLRRIREHVLDPQDLAILYVDLDDSGAAFVRTLEVDGDGDLVDGWPGELLRRAARRGAAGAGRQVMAERAEPRSVLGIGIASSALAEGRRRPGAAPGHP